MEREDISRGLDFWFPLRDTAKRLERAASTVKPGGWAAMVRRPEYRANDAANRSMGRDLARPSVTSGHPR